MVVDIGAVWVFIAGALTAVILIAGALRSAKTIASNLEDGFDWLWWRRRRAHQLDDLAEVADSLRQLVDPAGWPNGAKSLQESHAELYAAMSELQRGQQAIGEWLAGHSAHHIDLEAAIYRTHPELEDQLPGIEDFDHDDVNGHPI